MRTLKDGSVLYSKNEQIQVIKSLLTDIKCRLEDIERKDTLSEREKQLRQKRLGDVKRLERILLKLKKTNKRWFDSSLTLNELEGILQ